jgi:hypothetical protein
MGAKRCISRRKRQQRNFFDADQFELSAGLKLQLALVCLDKQ